MFGKLRVGYNWSVIEVDYNLGKYLRNLLYLTSNKTLKLQQPSNQEHITLISPYETNNYNKSVLENYDGLRVEFEISTELFTNGNAYWVTIISNRAEKIRESVGLPKQSQIPLHFCIGYIKEGKL